MQNSPSPAPGRRTTRAALITLLFLLAFTQYPVLSLANRITPTVAGFPFLFCYLFVIFVIFSTLLLVIGR